MNDNIDHRCKYPDIKCARCGRLINEHNDIQQDLGTHRKGNGYKYNLRECIDLGGFKVRSNDQQTVGKVSAWRIHFGLDDPFSNDRTINGFTTSNLEIINSGNMR